MSWEIASFVEFRMSFSTASWRAWARQLKHESLALALAIRDPRTPWWGKLLAGAVVAYALSPIDLIPDFIPVLGYLDDILLVPLGVVLVRRFIPADVLNDCRQRATKALVDGSPIGRVGAAVIVSLWFLTLGLAAFWFWSIP